MILTIGKRKFVFHTFVEISEIPPWRPVGSGVSSTTGNERHTIFLGTGGKV